MGSVPPNSPLSSLSFVRLSPNVPVVPLVWLGGIMGGWSGSWDKQFNSICKWTVSPDSRAIVAMANIGSLGAGALVTQMLNANTLFML